jgi:hypothetical protein
MIISFDRAIIGGLIVDTGDPVVRLSILKNEECAYAVDHVNSIEADVEVLVVEGVLI